MERASGATPATTPPLPAPSPERVPFVSRSRGEDGREPAPPPLGADGRALPELGDSALLILLALVAVLQGVSWWILHGYQLADSVEYMERAQSLVRGEEVVDASGVRSFGYSALLVPFFALADWIGVEDFRPVVWAVRVLQMALGLALVRICARLGARFAGYRAGLAAGFAVGVNPLFLQYSVSPVSDIAAAVCIGHALEALLERGDGRRGLRGGLWLGAAILMTYKALIVAAPLVLVVLLRDRLRRRAHLGGILAGLAAALCVQVALDRLVYGEWGASLVRYFMSNFASIVAPWVARVDEELGRRLYASGLEFLAQREDELRGELSSTPADIRSLSPATFYLTQLHTMIVWPLLLFLGLGILRCVKQASWRSTMLLVVLALDLLLMSRKGSKDFRLWIPLLPLIAPLCAWGFALFAGLHRERLSAPRLALALALLVAAGALGMDRMMARNTRKFAGYWDAIDYVNARVREERALRPDLSAARVSSAYHWAVYLRQSPEVELVKLPHHLDHWATKYGEEERAADMEAIAELDWFLTHLAVLSNPEHRDLMEFVNARFQVEAVLWDRKRYEDVGAVLVLRKLTGDPDARRFFRVHEDADPERYRRERLLPPPTRFVRNLVLRDEESGEIYEHLEQVELLGFEYEEVPGDGHGWITYHWHCGSEMKGNYAILDRLTTTDERNTWQNNHPPAYGVHPMKSSLEGGWQPGWIVEESWIVIAAADPLDWRKPYRPMGGAWRRGDVMPASLWIDLAIFEAPGVPRVKERLEPAEPGSDLPVRRGEDAGARQLPGGWVFSEDGMVRVGRFFLPVHDSARLRDDGRPVPP